MTDDQMKKYISTRVTKSDLNPFSRMTYGTITAIIILCVYTIMTVPAAHAAGRTTAGFWRLYN